MPEHVIVIHRWSDRYADYGSYLDHSATAVSYVTTEQAAAHLPTDAASVHLVSSTEDHKGVREAVDTLISRSGPPTRIVALHETDLDLAAELRGDYGLPGLRSEDLQPLRDKLLMTRRLEAAGVPVPATAEATGPNDVAAFARTHGWPVIVKPRRGTASADVTRVDSAEQLALYSFPHATAMVVQPWLPHRILHVDGIFTGDKLEVWRASRYVNTCLEFTTGSALGSVEIDDSEELARIARITERAARAVFSDPSVFHLELFDAQPALGGPGQGPPEASQHTLTVLEIAGRPGGAEVPFIWREVHGIDLMAAAFAHQTGSPTPAPRQGQNPDQVGGWLLVPPSHPAPCRVRSRPALPGTGMAPYTEVLPAPGQQLHGGGYEHAGARFRFRGDSTAEVEAAIIRTARHTTLESTAVDPQAPGQVVLIGCGNPPYREYSLAAASARTQTALVQRAQADWQRSYIAQRHRNADTADPDATAQAVADLLAGHHGPAGILTWDETLLETAAQVARKLGVPHMAPEAVRRCRDKLTTRGLLRDTGVPSADFTHAHTRQQALDAAARLGYPVVVKPRSLAGSIGVMLAADPVELGDAFEQAAGSSFPGITGLPGVIVEEYLTGPEISVDCAVFDGQAHVVNVARKRLGYAPYFEEIGHLVAPWRHEPWAEETVATVERAHSALDIRTGITHTELRLTPAGPRVVEVNGRLGGDFIPLLGSLATGVDQVAAAVDIALGRAPQVRPHRDRCAEVRFVYPEYDGVVRSLDLTAAASVPGVADVVALGVPGAELLLPPRGIVPRLAAVLVTGETPQECGEVADEAVQAVRAEVTPFEAVSAGQS